MIDNIRQILYQMLVLVEYEGDKDVFIANFLHECQKSLSPAYSSAGDYYNELHKATLKKMNDFVKKVSPQLTPNQIRNLQLLTQSATFH